MKIFGLLTFLLILSNSAFAANGGDFLNSFVGAWESKEGAALTPGTRGTVQFWVDRVQADPDATRFTATAVCSYIDRNGTPTGWTITSDWDGEKLILGPDGLISKKCFGRQVSMGYGEAAKASIDTISCWHHQDGKRPDNIRLEKLDSTYTYLTISHRDGTICSGKVSKY